jgi:hydrogenase maturation protease
MVSRFFICHTEGMAAEQRVLILGVGNTLLSDDGVGVFAARRARELVEPDEPIDIKEAELAGFALVDLLSGYESAVIVDALHGTGGQPGEVVALHMGNFAATTHLVTGHQIDLPTAIRLGEEMGRSVPQKIKIVGIQIADDRTLSEECTPEVQKAIEPAARLALKVARQYCRTS